LKNYLLVEEYVEEQDVRVILAIAVNRKQGRFTLILIALEAFVLSQEDWSLVIWGLSLRNTIRSKRVPFCLYDGSTRGDRPFPSISSQCNRSVKAALKIQSFQAT
jgi:hypothetical protein